MGACFRTSAAKRSRPIFWPRTSFSRAIASRMPRRTSPVLTRCRKLRKVFTFGGKGERRQLCGVGGDLRLTDGVGGLNDGLLFFASLIHQSLITPPALVPGA